MLVAVGLGPVTGQPLPLISRGGTSVLITSIYFGIMMGVSREQLELRDRVNETIEQSQEDVPVLEVD
jgi:cell division protein FtsW